MRSSFLKSQLMLWVSFEIKEFQTFDIAVIKQCTAVLFRVLSCCLFLQIVETTFLLLVEKKSVYFKLQTPIKELNERIRMSERQINSFQFRRTMEILRVVKCMTRYKKSFAENIGQLLYQEMVGKVKKLEHWSQHGETNGF